MPANDWNVLVAVVIGIVVLFAAAIVLGLRFGTRKRARLLRETKARDVLTAAGLGSDARANLLYGVWQMRTTDVVLHVRDGSDSDIGTIIQRPLGGADIAFGDESYTVVVTSGWRESAVLVRSGENAAAPSLCHCEIRGWGGGRIARYTLPDNRAISIRARWSLPWNLVPLPILEDGRVIGQLVGIGKVTNIGRALVLPTTLPLAVRLFILYKAEGARRG